MLASEKWKSIDYLEAYYGHTFTNDYTQHSWPHFVPVITVASFKILSVNWYKELKNSTQDSLKVLEKDS